MSFATAQRFIGPSQRMLAAIVVSIAAHAAVLSGLHPQTFMPSTLSAFDPIEVQLVSAPAPRVREKVVAPELPAPVPPLKPSVKRTPAPPRPVVATKRARRAETPPVSAASPKSDAQPAPTLTEPVAGAAPVDPAAGASPKAAEPLVQARSDAASLNNPKPPYPLLARRRRLEGEVLLSVHVLSDGSSERVRLKRSSGHSMLDEAARETVERWRFVPARRGSTPVDSLVEVPIRFRLEP